MKNKEGMFEAVFVSPIQVTLDECNGNSEKMIKKFIRKVRKEELLKPYYERLMYFETKSQKRRKKERQAKFNNSIKKEEDF